MTVVPLPIFSESFVGGVGRVMRSVRNIGAA